MYGDEKFIVFIYAVVTTIHNVRERMNTRTFEVFTETRTRRAFFLDITGVDGTRTSEPSDCGIKVTQCDNSERDEDTVDDQIEFTAVAASRICYHQLYPEPSDVYTHHK